jgi:hypothetical protein
MCGWMRQCADLLDSLYRKLKDFVLASKVGGNKRLEELLPRRWAPVTR